MNKPDIEELRFWCQYWYITHLIHHGTAFQLWFFRSNFIVNFQGLSGLVDGLWKGWRCVHWMVHFLNFCVSITIMLFFCGFFFVNHLFMLLEGFPCMVKLSWPSLYTCGSLKLRSVNSFTYNCRPIFFFHSVFYLLYWSREQDMFMSPSLGPISQNMRQILIVIC